MAKKNPRTAAKPVAVRDYAIGEVARLAGIKVPTIRYYESIGLVGEPQRTLSGRRVYDEHAVQRLEFIRHARALGFDIDDIRRLLDLSGEPQRSCADVDAIAKAHLANIDSRIKRLKALRRELQHMISECAHGRVCECRILEALSDHDHFRQG